MAANQQPSPLGINSAGMPCVRGQNVITLGTFNVKPGAGTFVGLNVNTAAATAVAKIYDGVDGTGTLLATIDCSVSKMLQYYIGCAVGVTIITSVAPADLTILFT